MGDTIYASSLAKKLKEMGYDRVVYLDGVPQTKGMLSRNPYIDEVFVTRQPTSNTHNIPVEEKFDKEILIPECKFIEPPALQMQKAAEIPNPSPDFEVYTDPFIDDEVVRTYEGQPYITVMEPASWEAKAYRFTKEDYIRGVDIPPKGYGGALRSIKDILHNMRETLDRFEKEYRVIYVGAPPTHPTLSIPFMRTDRGLDIEASLIKNSVAFIGAEGGLANLAAGVGTRTILTYDFVYQLYGWNGVIRPTRPEPKLGPRYYFPNISHVDINPYLDDATVGQEIAKSITMMETEDSIENHRIFLGDGEIYQWL